MATLGLLGVSLPFVVPTSFGLQAIAQTVPPDLPRPLVVPQSPTPQPQTPRAPDLGLQAEPGLIESNPETQLEPLPEPVQGAVPPPSQRDPLVPTDDAGGQAAGANPSDVPGSLPPQMIPVGPEEPELPLPDALTLADVVASIYRAYPEVNRARQEFTRANGELVSAYGAYDVKLNAHTISEPTGFYENYRHGIKAARQLWWGGNVEVGYRVGRGRFQPWYLERETEQGGEFKLGLTQPLLQGRAIDPQRLALFQTTIDREAADPVVLQSILDTSRDGMMAYWQWVAAGAVLQSQRVLLQLAVIRGEQFKAGFEADKFAEIDVVLNQQLIAERRAKVTEVERKFRSNAFKLSLFLRDEAGTPLVPDDRWRPRKFPKITPIELGEINDEIATALQFRPEPRLLQLELEKLSLDRRWARNQTLPRLDFLVESSHDFGGRATSSDDKGEPVLVVGAVGEVPVQRRKARGKIQSTTAKIAQTSEKLRLQQDKIGAEIRDARTAVLLTTQIVEQAELAFETAIKTREAYRFGFQQGKYNLIEVNLIEVKATETEIKLIEARRDYYSALGILQAAIGLDPLEQAALVSESGE